ncbi:hypothetical protein LTS12_026612 [Elasticomyces elasticus]|nr:hypothetical protein LTS12_026612 [Elasticomyces elasticus]
MAILWIPGHSEAAIKQAFEQYARQICGNDQQYAEPMSLLGGLLDKRFPGRWLVVFDALDVPLINIQQYLFTDMEDSKILITTRNSDLAPSIKATHDIPMSPLDEKLGGDLLDMYINTESTSSTAGQAVQVAQTIEERNARIRIVKELGGLPLAIAIVGAALREKTGRSSFSSKAYLAWTDEFKETLLEHDPLFSDYSVSIWKAFQFAFHEILQGTGFKEYAAHIAHFSASCEDASSIAEYIRLYRDVGSRDAASNRNTAVRGRTGISRLHFLDGTKLGLGIDALAAVSMVTVNWAVNQANDVPHIEMHSLAWLIGFSMYTHLKEGRVATSRFEPLLEHVKKGLLENTPVGKDVPAPETALALLLDAQMKLTRSFDFFPAGSAQRSRLRGFSGSLELELAASYDDNLNDLDWSSVFGGWAESLAELVESVVGYDAQRDGYNLKDFFLETLDSHGCVSSAFQMEAPDEFRQAGETKMLLSIQANLGVTIGVLLEGNLDRKAFECLAFDAAEDSSEFFHAWSRRWGKDVTEILRKCLADVVARVQPPSNAPDLATEDTLSSISVTVTDPQSIGASMRAMMDPNDPRNAFFAILRRTVERVVGRALDSSRAKEELNEQKETFRALCEPAVWRGFGDRAADMSRNSHGHFSLLWSLAWPARFPGALDDLIAQVTLDGISEALQHAAKQGFRSTLEKYIDNRSSCVERLADEVFGESAISNMFLNWISAGWIDPLQDGQDSEEEESSYADVMYQARQQTMTVMESTYDSPANVVHEGAVVQALHLTLESRRLIHNTVMDKLRDPEVSDRTGVGPYFAMLHFEDCDTSLRLACAVLGGEPARNLANSLDHLNEVENAWTSRGHTSR